jgi:hypothetical protein
MTELSDVVWGRLIIRPQKMRYAPLWLSSEIPVKVGEQLARCKDINWGNVLSFQVPADHKHYTLT